jgi:hypothetical protein
MSAEVAEAIRQTRRTLAEKTWVPWWPAEEEDECCLLSALPSAWPQKFYGLCVKAFRTTVSEEALSVWNDRQTDVGAVLGMTLEALIAELCKPTLAPRGSEA